MKRAGRKGFFLGTLVLVVFVLTTTHTSQETIESPRLLLLYDSASSKQFVERCLELLDSPPVLSSKQIPPGQPVELKISELGDVDVIFFVMREYPVNYSEVVVSILAEFSANGGNVLVWQPSLMSLPASMRAFLALTNITHEWEFKVSVAPQFNLRVVDPEAFSVPSPFTANEPLSFFGFGSAIDPDETVHELVELESVQKLPFSKQAIHRPAACYVSADGGGRRYLVSVSPFSLEQNPRFADLMTDLFYQAITTSSGMQSPNSQEPPVTSEVQEPVQTSEPQIAPETTEGKESQEVSTPTAEITEDGMIEKIPPIVALGAALALGGLGGAAILARSVPPPTIGKITRKDFIERLLWYFFYPVIWVIGHIVYPPVIRRLKEEDILENEIRVRILDLLTDRGVAHFREIQRVVTTSFSVLKWHLQVLEDFGFVRHTKVGRYTVYYCTQDSLIVRSKEAAFLLKSENVRKIMNSIIRNQNVHQAELARLVDLHHDTIQYHVDKLINVGLLCALSDGKFTRYYLTDEQQTLVQELLDRIKPEEDGGHSS